MQLLYSPMSPFARKVRVVAHELGLRDRIEISFVNPWQDESLRAHNPLCQVPTLITDEGQALYDSAVICEYLDSIGGGGIIPTNDARFTDLTIQALADGIGDAAVKAVVEGRREDARADFIARQHAAIEAGLDYLEGVPISKQRFGIAEIAIAAQLGYLDFRQVTDWRAGRPKLSAWYEVAARRDSMVATEPVQLA